jgi:uncharacterized protein YqgC (DUF456 family)
MAVVFALLLIVVLLACWPLTLLGMPGNWLMAAATALYAYLVPAQSIAALGWKTVVALLVLAALGEIVELLAGAFGVAKAGGSRRGALMALVGSIVGGILGIFVGVPIPLIGSVVAAVLFAGLGAMAGAALGETSAGRDAGASWRIAKLAFWGRLAGTLGKVILGAVMIAVVIASLIVTLTTA